MAMENWFYKVHDDLYVAGNRAYENNLCSGEQSFPYEGLFLQAFSLVPELAGIFIERLTHPRRLLKTIFLRRTKHTVDLG